MNKYYKIDLGIEIKNLPLFFIKNKYLNFNNYPELKYRADNKKILYTEKYNYNGSQYILCASLDINNFINFWFILLFTNINIVDERYIKISKGCYKLQNKDLIFRNNIIFGNKNKSFKTNYFFIIEVKKTIDKFSKKKLNNKNSIVECLFNIFKIEK